VAGIGHQRRGVSCQPIAEFDTDEHQIEGDGNEEGPALGVRVMAVVVAVALPVVVAMTVPMAGLRAAASSARRRRVRMIVIVIVIVIRTTGRHDRRPRLGVGECIFPS
jgi:hypothetical protein